MSDFIKKTRSVIFALGLFLSYGFLSRFWRIRHLRMPEIARLKQSPVLYAHWHGDELFLIGAHTGSGMAVMASRSQDGEMLALLLKWFGYRVVRGSSSRGGAGGLKGLIDTVLREKCDASLAVDGPRGPIYQVKPGIIKLAQETGAPIVCGVSNVNWKFVFKKAWNKCYLPYPFAKGVVLYSEPRYISKDATKEELEIQRVQLQSELTKLKEEVDREFSKA